MDAPMGGVAAQNLAKILRVSSALDKAGKLLTKGYSPCTRRRGCIFRRVPGRKILILTTGMDLRA
jgi:hypothetical protein